MLDRIKAWLDKRAEARRAQQATPATTRRARDAADGADANAGNISSSRRAGLRARGAAVAKPAAGEEAYVLVTVGTTKFEALIK
jgi:hypothetical protein